LKAGSYEVNNGFNNNNTNNNTNNRQRRTTMPNWCYNTLTITGSSEKLKEFSAKAYGHDQSYTKGPIDAEEKDKNLLSLHRLYPVPKEVLEAGYNAPTGVKPLEYFNEAYGYGWEALNWGCKWGACDVERETLSERTLEYNFSTPWAPPIKAFEHISRKWPELHFELEYEELGNEFEGKAIFKGGLIIDDCRDIPDDPCADLEDDEEEEATNG